MLVIAEAVIRTSTPDWERDSNLKEKEPQIGLMQVDR